MHEEARPLTHAPDVTLHGEMRHEDMHKLVVKERICKGYCLVAAAVAEQRIQDLFHSFVNEADRTSSEKPKKRKNKKPRSMRE